ncbi:MAG TPA: MBL fold metallo-hydrolase [Thermoanaerobaculia bacterium]|nr:MBL fold metallo-hydrolase [Thermoanaerobaculia bacterium]
MAGDYPSGRGRVRIVAGGLEIEGVSIAGHESFYKLPAFRCLLEFGRAPDDVVSYSTICLTHGHLDHAAGLAHHSSRRRLARMPPARVFAPEEAVPDLEAWLAISHRLENVDYGVHVTPAVPGETVLLRNDLSLRFLPGRHRVPTVGYLFSEVRRKLAEDLVGRGGEEIAALRAGGTDVTRVEETPLLAYPGDCGVGIFDAAPELFGARVLLIECSFLGRDDQHRAREYEHIHLDDIAERASLFRNEAIVLTHFSMRYRPAEILEALARLPAGLRERVVPFLPGFRTVKAGSEAETDR